MQKRSLLLLILIAFAVLLCILGASKRELDEGFDYASDERQSFAPIGSSLAVIGKTELYVYSSDGAELLCLELSMSGPEASSSGEHCLVWDRGGTEWILLSENGEYESGSTEKPIICSAYSNDMTVICTESKTRLADITVLGSGQKPLMRYGISSLMPNSLCLSPDGECLALLSEEKLLLLSTENGMLLSEHGISAKEMHWLSDDALCLVGESTIYLSGPDGDIKSCDIDGTVAQAAFGDGFAVVFSQKYKSGGGGTLMCFSDSLRLLGKRETEGVNSLSASGELILLSERDRCRILGTDMIDRDSVNVNSALTAILCGDSAFIIQKAHVYVW